MDKPKTPQLTIDREFRDLIRPLMKDEYRYLESTLISEGCQEPITVWKGIIVDGHNRYEICTRLGIPFDTRERHFDNREEAIIWICARQLGRRNISDETRRYLIGKRYEAEKVIAAKRNYNGWNQYRKESIRVTCRMKSLTRMPSRRRYARLSASEKSTIWRTELSKSTVHTARPSMRLRRKIQPCFHAYCQADTKYRTTML